MLTYATTELMHIFQQKGKGLQEIKFEFSQLTQAVTNCET